jgi:hypothetical protein
MKNKQPLCFGGVRLGKNYVSFYLMTVYASPDLLKAMSPELKKRMQGKSCFNFKEVDQQLFSELKTITKAGAAKFSDGKFIEALRKMQDRGTNGRRHLSQTAFNGNVPPCALTIQCTIESPSPATQGPDRALST